MKTKTVRLRNINIVCRNYGYTVWLDGHVVPINERQVSCIKEFVQDESNREKLLRVQETNWSAYMKANNQSAHLLNPPSLANPTMKYPFVDEVHDLISLIRTDEHGYLAWIGGDGDKFTVVEEYIVRDIMRIARPMNYIEKEIGGSYVFNEGNLLSHIVLGTKMHEDYAKESFEASNLEMHVAVSSLNKRTLIRQLNQQLNQQWRARSL